jgi:hypothetical protein
LIKILIYYYVIIGFIPTGISSGFAHGMHKTRSCWTLYPIILLPYISAPGLQCKKQPYGDVNVEEFDSSLVALVFIL